MSKSKILSAASAASAAAPPPVSLPVAAEEEESPALTMEHLLAILRAATEEQRTEVLGLLGAAPTPAKKAVGGAGAKKTAVPAARKAAVAAPLPEPDEDGAPSASAYRIKEEDIDHAVCVGRVLKGGEDKRWKPVVYREFQCGKATEEDCDLCKTCQGRLEKFADDPKSGGDWNGRVTEDPHAGVHMLDTEWAEARKPRWMGEGASASDSGSEASSAAASSAASKAAEKEAAKAAKEAEKEAAKAKKEAEKAAKAAEKESAKSAKEAEKAAKAAEKEAAKAAKEAEKAEKAAAKKTAPAKKAAAPAVKKAAGGAGAATPASAPAKADSAAAAEEVEMELKLIDGTIYMVKDQKVYKYDEDSEEAGEYVGRLTADELIDSSVGEEDEE